MEKEAEEKKRRSSKVSRFGREQCDSPVEYRPIVRQGGRKIKAADGSQLRVPVKSSFSNPLDAVRKKEIKEERPETVPPKEQTPAGNDGPAPAPEQRKKTRTYDDMSFSVESFMDGTDAEEKDETGEDIAYGVSDGMRKDLDLPDRTVMYRESEYRDSGSDMPMTPFDRRKRAIECGIPAKFFYAMNKGGYLDGRITEESASGALRAFLAARIAEKIETGGMTLAELGRVSAEIRKMRAGMPCVINERDIKPEATSEDIFRMILEKIRRGI